MKVAKNLQNIMVLLLVVCEVMSSAIPVMAAETGDSLSTEPTVTNLLSSLGESGSV